LICSEKPVPPSKNLLPGKGVDNLTELNFQVTETLGSIQPKRVALEILSDVLLRHKALQTRKWLNELLERLRSRGITTLAVLNPYMHSPEEVQAVVDLFDGNLEVVEREVEDQLRKVLRIRWVHGVEAVEDELPLLDLIPERLEPVKQGAAAASHFKEPRWFTTLVGRTVELSKLKGAFEDALGGRSCVIVLQGEAGVGKTRLMQELALYAQPRATVLSGDASEAGLPYAPWVELARQYVATAPGELLRRMLGGYASELVKLVPDLAAKLGTIPSSKPLGERADKIRFYEAVTQFFISISTESPLLLLFDDMQSSDQSSLELLEHFVRSTSNLRVLTACAYRAEETPADSPLYRTLMRFNRQRLLETVQVKNLSREETTELIKQTFGEQTISPEFADLLHHRTGGNPFFVEEVLRSLVEDGIIFRTKEKWDRKPIQEIILPESVRSVLKSRLARLQPETLNALSMASVIGSEFDFEVLREVSQLEEDTLLQRLEAAFSAGLVQQVPRQRTIFKFSDDRIKELLLNDLIPIRKAKYHFRIAEAMQKVYSKNLEGQAESLANHFSEGGDTEQTVRYSIMAGNRNVAVYAYEQAIQNFKGALDVLETQTGKDEKKAAVLEKLARTLDLAGQERESCKYYEQALPIFEQLQDFKACTRITVGLSKALFRSKPSGAQDALQMLKRNLKYLEEDPESFEAAEFYSVLMWWLRAMGRRDEAMIWNEEAQRAGEKSNNFSAVSDALTNEGFYLLGAGRFDEAMQLLEKACELALQHEQYMQASQNLCNLSIAVLGKDLVKARALALQALELNERHIRSPRYEASAYSLLSMVHWLSGDWILALDEINKALDIADRLGFMNDNIVVGEVDRARYFLHMGDFKKAEKYLETSKAKQSTSLDHQSYFNQVLGELRFEQGRVEDAKQHLESCLKAIREWKLKRTFTPDVEPLLSLTSIYIKLGQPEEARATSDLAKSLGERYPWSAFSLAEALQAEAAALLAGGNRKAAEEAYLKSLASWEKAGWPYYKAKALVAYSESIAQTNPDQSRKHLEEAAEIFKKLGAKRDLEKAQAKLS
jgi:tetratricopeptide (TPR) repeat protein